MNNEKEMSWINQEKGNYKFNLNEVLKDSLFYPACKFDGSPIKHAADFGKLNSFVYVDYGVTEENLQQEIMNGFKGYKLSNNQRISQECLVPNGVSYVVSPDNNEYRSISDEYNPDNNPPFCRWYIFEREEGYSDDHGPKIFSLLYLCSDGAAAFQNLYISNKIKPKVIAIIQPGHGCGGNWTNYFDRKSILARSVFYNEQLVPDFLLTLEDGRSANQENSCWPEFGERVKSINGSRYSGAIWKK
jgi:hypothetical protein